MDITPIFETRDTLSVKERDQLLAYFAEQLFYRLEPGKLTSRYIDGEDAFGGLEETLRDSSHDDATHALLSGAAHSQDGDPDQKLISKLLRPILRGFLNQRI